MQHVAAPWFYFPGAEAYAAYSTMGVALETFAAFDGAVGAKRTSATVPPLVLRSA